MSTASILTPPPPPNPWPKRIAMALAIVVVVGAALYWQFRYYPEKRQVARFFDALVAGDYPGAYQIWGPTPEYTYQDFLTDWGETTPRGRIRSYEILRVEEPAHEIAVRGGPRLVLGPESSGVVVVVRLNGTTEIARIWVEKKDKKLGFAPF